MNSYRKCAVVVVQAAIMSFSAHADDILKANNANNLGLGSSWVGAVAPSAADVAVWGNTVLSANTTLLGGNLSWQGIRIASPGGLVTINSGNTLTLGSAGIDMTAATQNLVFNNAVLLGAPQTWEMQAGRTLTMTGGVTGVGNALTLKGGDSTVRAPFVGLGSLAVDGGTVSFGDNSSSTISNLYIRGGGGIYIGATAGNQVISGDTVVSNGFISFSNRAAYNTGTLLLKAGGSMQMTGIGGGNTAITMGGLIVEQPASGAYTFANLLNINSSNRRAVFTLNGTLSLVGAAGNANSVVFAANPATGTFGDGYVTWSGSRIFDIGDGGADVDLRFEARLVGSGLLVKSGAGTMALIGVGTNTYSGGTVVSNGTLLVNNAGGSGTGSGGVTVEAGGTLGGGGLITGAVEVKDNATLSPGNSAGTITVGQLTLRDASVLEFELGETNDLVRVVGNLILDGNLYVSALSGFESGIYTLFTYTGSLTDNGLNVMAMPGGYFGSIVLDEDNKLVNLSVIPEPGMLSMLLLGAMMLTWYRRR